jgi:hypothetical protein
VCRDTNAYWLSLWPNLTNCFKDFDWVAHSVFE